MRILDKVLTLALLLVVCPNLVQAKIYKIEDYKKQRTFEYKHNRINCADFSWDVANCERMGGILTNPLICRSRGGRASNSCICPNDYIEVENNITLNPHFEYNNRTIITLTDKDNNTKYCVPEPTKCSDRSYVMTEILDDYVNRSFDITTQEAGENIGLNITTTLAGIDYAINNSNDNPAYQFTVRDTTYYCAPNNAGSYNLSTTQPTTDRGSEGESSVNHVSLHEIPTTNTHAAQSTISVGGLLDDLQLHYLSGCQTGWNLAIDREPNATTDCSNGQGINYNSNGSFTYIANEGQHSGYCYKCTGCANGLSGTPGHYTLLGDLEGSNASLEGNDLNTEAFTSGNNCAVSCNADEGWSMLYVGPENEAPFTRNSQQKTCIGGTGEGRCGNGTVQSFRYEIATLTKQADNARYIQVCVKKNGCNIEAGYIGGCQYNCWKSFFSTGPNLDLDSELSRGITPNTGGGSGNSANGNGNGNGETPSQSCGSEFIWDSTNCTSPNVPQGSQCEGKYNQCACPIFDGQAYTSAIVGQLGCVDNSAACETTKYYPTNVSASDSHFGQGHWYLPAIGELYQLYTVKSTIDSALSSISGTNIPDQYHWSSSEANQNGSLILNISNGKQLYNYKNYYQNVRAFLLCENCFTSLPLSRARPVIGDIVYSDLSYDSYSHTHSDKTPVGVVVWVSSSGTTARIVALNELGNTMPWGGRGTNITNLPDIPSTPLPNGCSWTIPE